jgi:hypothetical protein
LADCGDGAACEGLTFAVPAMELLSFSDVFLPGWYGARKRHAWDYSDHHSHFAAHRRIADVAV